VTAADVLLALVDAGVVLWVEGDRLRYRAPIGAISTGLRAAAAERRKAVIALVKAGAVLPASLADWPQVARADLDERTFALEYDGGLEFGVAEDVAERLMRIEHARAFVARNALVVQPQAAAVAGERPGGGPNRRP